MIVTSGRLGETEVFDGRIAVAAQSQVSIQRRQGQGLMQFAASVAQLDEHVWLSVHRVDGRDGGGGQHRRQRRRKTIT